MNRLEPRRGHLHVVRWVRADGRDVRHRYYRRPADARRFLAKLHASGHEAAMFSSPVTWQRTDPW